MMRDESIERMEAKQKDCERLIDAMQKLSPAQIKVYADMMESLAAYNRLERQFGTAKRPDPEEPAA